MTCLKVHSFIQLRAIITNAYHQERIVSLKLQTSFLHPNYILLCLNFQAYLTIHKLGSLRVEATDEDLYNAVCCNLVSPGLHPCTASKIHYPSNNSAQKPTLHRPLKLNSGLILTFEQSH
ncbi:hypothetical protein Hanom_Chr11g01050981 [Helianthus anomalus]